MNAAQVASCYCGCCWEVVISRWGPGRWAVSSRGSSGQWSRRGRQVWRHASHGAEESQPNTWLSSLSRRGHMAQNREWGLRHPHTPQAHSPATAARRDPRSCTGDILAGWWSLHPLLDLPLSPISGPNRGVRGRGHRRGRPRVDALQGWS